MTVVKNFLYTIMDAHCWGVILKIIIDLKWAITNWVISHIQYLCQITMTVNIHHSGYCFNDCIDSV